MSRLLVELPVHTVYYTNVGFMAVFCVLHGGKAWTPKYCAKYKISYCTTRYQEDKIPYRKAGKKNEECLPRKYRELYIPDHTVPFVNFWNAVPENTPSIHGSTPTDKSIMIHESQTRASCARMYSGHNIHEDSYLWNDLGIQLKICSEITIT